MKNIQLKEFLPYISGIILFLLITLMFFQPMMEGKKLRQQDNINYLGMSKEIRDYRESTGKEALWTNSMFGGMPAYQISYKVKNNILPYIDKVFTMGISSPAGMFFLYMLGFFILLLVLRVNPWLSIAGAIAFGLSSYFIIIIEAGHNSKVHAIGYMAPVIAGILLTLRGRWITGGALTALFIALELNSGHPQITYYLFIIILFILTGELIERIRKKTIGNFVKAIGVMVVAGIIAILPNLANIWATYEYGKLTIRGKTELTTEMHNRTSGLDKDYATDWSYGIGESFSLMIPNVKGGVSQAIGNNEKALKDVEQQFKQAIAESGVQYWGEQPFTSGPVYAGAVVIFFFVLSLFILKGRFKWALLSVTILSLMLAWGKNFWALTDFFLEYVPLYNKFRAVSTTLVIAELTIPLLAILGLNEIIKNPGLFKDKIKALSITLGITGGLSLLFYVLPTMFFDFASTSDLKQIAEQKKAYPDYAQYFDLFLSNLEIARIAIFKADALRSLLFIILSATLIWLFIKEKIKLNVFLIALTALILIDLFPIAKRYLKEENFVEGTEVKNPFPMSRADNIILSDTANYRVLNLVVNTFNDAGTSYYHKSIGGYHGAKLRRYQEIIENHLSNEIGVLRTVFSDTTGRYNINDALKGLNVLNMLNTKYFIINRNQPFVNNYALGDAWFVNEYKLVNNADEEIEAIKNIEPSTTAVVDKRFVTKLSGLESIKKDTTAKIRLLKYEPNNLIYHTESNTAGLAVFSEIYYDKGWEAYIDGQKAEYIRANFILRAMKVPEGKHRIEFKFQPKVYYTGEKISLIGSVMILLLIVSAAYFEIFRKQK